MNHTHTTDQEAAAYTQCAGVIDNILPTIANQVSTDGEQVAAEKFAVIALLVSGGNVASLSLIAGAAMVAAAKTRTGGTGPRGTGGMGQAGRVSRTKRSVVDLHGHRTDRFRP